MRLIWDFLFRHNLDVLSAFFVVLWYFSLWEGKKSLLKLALFPVYYRSASLDIRKNPLVFPLAYNYLLFIQNLAMVLSGMHAYVYLSSWVLIFMYEIYAPAQYLFGWKNKRFLFVFLAFFLLLAVFHIYRALQLKNYEPVNQADFIEVFTLFVASVYILAKIVVRDQFDDDFRAFFLFFGLALYSFLQCLSTILIALDFQGNFEFAAYSAIITNLFWLISIPWLRHLKSKLM